MRVLPKTKNAPLLRTYFSDDVAWQRLCAKVQEPAGEFRANVTPVSDPAFDGATVEHITELGIQAGHRFAFVADQRALSDSEHPLLVVSFRDEPGRTFRVIPSAVWGVENNLSIANLGFEEFADAVDDDGVFRGFPE